MRDQDIAILEASLERKDREIEELKTKVSFLEQELDELEPYRIYFQMAMRLRHGPE